MNRGAQEKSSTKEILGLHRITKKHLKELCKKHKLYQTPHLNDQLYLHFQGFQAIENLEEYTGLKCLWLESNAISEIQGLDCQKELKCLFLQNNLIKKIENLDNCAALDTLNLASNHITRIENCGVDILPVLSTLNLSRNYLRKSDCLQELMNCKNLWSLDLSHNRIDDILVVKIFANMPELRVLVLQGNPVVGRVPQYRKTLILECKKLTYLDTRPVFPKDRACAEAWKRGGYEEERKEHERWIKMDRRRIRESVNATLRLRIKHGHENITLLESTDEEEEGGQPKKLKQVLEEPINKDLEITGTAKSDEKNDDAPSKPLIQVMTELNVVSTTKGPPETGDENRKLDEIKATQEAEKPLEESESTPEKMETDETEKPLTAIKGAEAKPQSVLANISEIKELPETSNKWLVNEPEQPEELPNTSRGNSVIMKSTTQFSALSTSSNHSCSSSSLSSSSSSLDTSSSDESSISPGESYKEGKTIGSDTERELMSDDEQQNPHPTDDKDDDREHIETTEDITDLDRTLTEASDGLESSISDRQDVLPCDETDSGLVTSFNDEETPRESPTSVTSEEVAAFDLDDDPEVTEWMNNFLEEFNQKQKDDEEGEDKEEDDQQTSSEDTATPVGSPVAEVPIPRPETTDVQCVDLDDYLDEVDPSDWLDRIMNAPLEPPKPVEEPRREDTRLGSGVYKGSAWLQNFWKVLEEKENQFAQPPQKNPKKEEEKEGEPTNQEETTPMESEDTKEVTPRAPIWLENILKDKDEEKIEEKEKTNKRECPAWLREVLVSLRRGDEDTIVPYEVREETDERQEVKLIAPPTEGDGERKYEDNQDDTNQCGNARVIAKTVEHPLQSDDHEPTVEMPSAPLEELKEPLTPGYVMEQDGQPLEQFTQIPEDNTPEPTEESKKNEKKGEMPAESKSQEGSGENTNQAAANIANEADGIEQSNEPLMADRVMVETIEGGKQSEVFTDVSLEASVEVSQQLTQDQIAEDTTPRAIEELKKEDINPTAEAEVIPDIEEQILTDVESTKVTVTIDQAEATESVERSKALADEESAEAREPLEHVTEDQLTEEKTPELNEEAGNCDEKEEMSTDQKPYEENREDTNESGEAEIIPATDERIPMDVEGCAKATVAIDKLDEPLIQDLEIEGAVEDLEQSEASVDVPLEASVEAGQPLDQVTMNQFTGEKDELMTIGVTPELQEEARNYDEKEEMSCEQKSQYENQEGNNGSSETKDTTEADEAVDDAEATITTIESQEALTPDQKIEEPAVEVEECKASVDIPLEGSEQASQSLEHVSEEQLNTTEENKDLMTTDMTSELKEDTRKHDIKEEVSTELKPHEVACKMEQQDQAALELGEQQLEEQQDCTKALNIEEKEPQSTSTSSNDEGPVAGEEAISFDEAHHNIQTRIDLNGELLTEAPTPMGVENILETSLEDTLEESCSSEDTMITSTAVLEGFSESESDEYSSPRLGLEENIIILGHLEGHLETIYELDPQTFQEFTNVEPNADLEMEQLEQENYEDEEDKRTLIDGDGCTENETEAIDEVFQQNDTEDQIKDIETTLSYLDEKISEESLAESQFIDDTELKSFNRKPAESDEEQEESAVEHEQHIVEHDERFTDETSTETDTAKQEGPQTYSDGRCDEEPTETEDNRALQGHENQEERPNLSSTYEEDTKQNEVGEVPVSDLLASSDETTPKVPDPVEEPQSIDKTDDNATSISPTQLKTVKKEEEIEDPPSWWQQTLAAARQMGYLSTSKPQEAEKGPIESDHEQSTTKETTQEEPTETPFVSNLTPEEQEQAALFLDRIVAGISVEEIVKLHVKEPTPIEKQPNTQSNDDTLKPTPSFIESLSTLSTLREVVTSFDKIAEIHTAQTYARSQRIQNFLEHPFTKQFQTQDPDQINRQYGQMIREQRQRISELVEHVYAQRDKYNDTLELINGRLMVVKKSTGAVEELPKPTCPYPKYVSCGVSTASTSCASIKRTSCGVSTVSTGTTTSTGGESGSDDDYRSAHSDEEDDFQVIERHDSDTIIKKLPLLSLQSHSLITYQEQANQSSEDEVAILGHDLKEEDGEYESDSTLYRCDVSRIEKLHKDIDAELFADMGQWMESGVEVSLAKPSVQQRRGEEEDQLMKNVLASSTATTEIPPKESTLEYVKPTLDPEL